MSHDYSDHPNVRADHPGQAVQVEAGKIIAKLDGVSASPWNIDFPYYDKDRAAQVREMLIKDSQTMSPQDMKELLGAVSKGEDKTKGYDLVTLPHTDEEIRERKNEVIRERGKLITSMANCTQKERIDAVAEFNKEHDLELKNFMLESVLQLTHDSTKGEFGQPGRTPGQRIIVAPYRIVNGLPDFKITDQSRS